jgi:hypothetical protein
VTEPPLSPDEEAFAALTGGARPPRGHVGPGRQVSRGLGIAGGAVLVLLAVVVLLALLHG